MFKFLSRFLDLNQKEIDRLKSRVDRVNQFTEQLRKLKKSEDFVASTAD